MIVYTGGTFDIPHMGHVNFFRKIKEYFPGCELVVSLNTDEFVEEFKGKKPLFSYNERRKFIWFSGMVDRIITNTGGADSKPAILSKPPHVIAIGNDWLEKDYCKQMGFTPQWLRDYDIALIYIPYTEGISTTEIKKRINAQ